MLRRDPIVVKSRSWLQLWHRLSAALLPLTRDTPPAVCCATQLSVAALMESGRILEASYGPLVLLVHVAMCGGGAAAAQVAFQPLPGGISGTGM